MIPMTPMTKNLALKLRLLLPLAAGAAITVATLYPLGANQHSAAAPQSSATMPRPRLARLPPPSPRATRAEQGRRAAARGG